MFRRPFRKKNFQEYSLIEKKKPIGFDPANVILGLWGGFTLYVIAHIVFQIKFPFLN